MKWFRRTNKGSLEQWNLCLCVRDQCTRINGSDFIDAWGIAFLFVYVLCVLGLWSWNRFQLRKHFQYFQNWLDQNEFGLLIPNLTPPFLN